MISLNLPILTPQADNTTGALDAILPEPFLQLHRPHMQSSMPLAPHLVRPTVSCFTGITVCLSSITNSPIRCDAFRARFDLSAPFMNVAETTSVVPSVVIQASP